MTLLAMNVQASSSHTSVLALEDVYLLVLLKRLPYTVQYVKLLMGVHLCVDIFQDPGCLLSCFGGIEILSMAPGLCNI